MRYGDKRTEKRYGKWTTTIKAEAFSAYTLDGSLQDAINYLQRILTYLPEGYTSARLDYDGEDGDGFIVYAERAPTPGEIAQAEHATPL